MFASALSMYGFLPSGMTWGRDKGESASSMRPRPGTDIPEPINARYGLTPSARASNQPPVEFSLHRADRAEAHPDGGLVAGQRPDSYQPWGNAPGNRHPQSHCRPKACFIGAGRRTQVYTRQTTSILQVSAWHVAALEDVERAQAEILSLFKVDTFARCHIISEQWPANYECSIRVPFT
jgi:hypothetical protein